MKRAVNSPGKCIRPANRRSIYNFKKIYRQATAIIPDPSNSQRATMDNTKSHFHFFFLFSVTIPFPVLLPYRG